MTNSKADKKIYYFFLFCSCVLCLFATIVSIVIITIFIYTKSRGESGSDDESSIADIQEESYSQEEIDYFNEIVFGSEYGRPIERVRKWIDEVEVQVKGQPSSEDLETVETVVADINEIVDGNITLKIVEDDPEVTMWFAPTDEMAIYEQHYISGNLGFFYNQWDDQYEIYYGNIVISTDIKTQYSRNHFIREELTQCLGLYNDSYAYEDSIFYQKPSSTQEYSDIDETIIEMLYLEEIELGMTRKEAENVFK